MDVIQIPLGGNRYPGLCALIDAEDWPIVAGYSWHPSVSDDGKPYARTTIHAAGETFRTHRMHRLIIGALPDELVDHWNRNTLDNRRSNLRLATPTQNAANAGIPRHNTSGYKGVNLRKDSGKYSASIRENGRTIKLGSFDTAENAALAYDFRARILFGEFAFLNFPEIVLDSSPPKSVKPFGASGVRGVYWLEGQRKWRVALSVAGKLTSIGIFASFDAAVSCARSHGSGQSRPLPTLLTEGSAGA